MRHKLKKEALDTIVQKMVNDSCGKYLADLLGLAQKVRTNTGISNQEITHDITWLYGYENEFEKAIESIKIGLEKKMFNKEASHVTIISGMVCYVAIISITNPKFDESKWEVLFEENENKRLIECLETLHRNCPKEINVDGFCEARRYIRIWDSAYNW